MKWSSALAVLACILLSEPTHSGPLDLFNPAKVIGSTVNAVKDPAKAIQNAIDTTIETVKDPGQTIRDAIDQTKDTITHPIESTQKVFTDTTQAIKDGVNGAANAVLPSTNANNNRPNNLNNNANNNAAKKPTATGRRGFFHHSERIQPSLANLVTTFLRALQNSLAEGTLFKDINSGLSLFHMLEDDLMYLMTSN